MAQEAPGEQPNNDEGCCADFAKETQEKRQERQSKPAPWLVLKFTILLSLGFIGFTTYVYVGRFCVPMLTRRPKAMGDRLFGIIFLVIFGVFLTMMLWAYAKVCSTSPGFAKDHVRPSPRPEAPPRDNTPIGGLQYSNESSPSSPTQHNLMPPPPAHDAVPPSPGGHSPSQSENIPPSQTKATSRLNLPSSGRRPSSTPVLLPAYRYCGREEFVKPLRAHHCRACGKCVLKYDHHCPWIGQCVGARNHKFFLQFLFWTFLFCIWTFSTSLSFVALPRNRENLDILKIVIIALSALFGSFTLIMFGAHTRLILLNITTVEQLRFQDIKDHESAILAEMYSMCAFSKKREVRARWDEEWGRPEFEGNIWWLGSKRKNWESVMGRSIWSWFLPIGKAENDGLNYPINPRFDDQGRWRKRAEWPSNLR